MSRRQISVTRQQQVRRRANFLCEYCHTSELWQYVIFTIDHIIPIILGGTNDLTNLALACFHCNRRKSNYIVAMDPLTQKEVSLFNPRQHHWGDHFIWSANRLYIVPLTAIGLATVEVLHLNRERVIAIRADDLVIGRHPPANDPIQSE